MAVDRGGLQYGIDVRDGFSAATKAFRKEIEASRASWRNFRKELGRNATAAGQAVGAFQQGAAALKAQRDAERALTVERKKSTASSKQATSASRERRRQIALLTAQVRQQQQAEAGALVFDRQRQQSFRKQARLEQQEASRRQKSIAVEQAARTNAQRQQLSLNAAIEQGARQFSRDRQRDLGRQSRIDKADLVARQRRQAVEEKSILAQQAAALETSRFGEVSRRAATGVRALNEQGKKGRGVFNQLLFTFRRLVGALAIFQAARLAARGFANAVVEGVRFNAQIETATLGIASVIAATGEVRNAMGGAATAGQLFAASQVLAQKQVQALRKDAIETNATFEQLLDTFQIAIGPGLAAGLDVDEIRKLSVRISQAATAIGLPQNQLSEEIRSILSGTIQLRTTRLAAVLGITNEDIRNARELGVLADFLQDRFQAFGRAGEESLKNFSVLLTNAGDAIRGVLAGGSFELFEELKGLFADVLDSVRSIDEEGGTVEFNASAVEFVKELLAGFKAAVAEARRLVGALSMESLIPIARLFSSIVTVIARTLGVAIQGFVAGASTVAALFNGILGVARQIANAFGFLTGTDSTLQSILSLSIELTTTFFALKGTLLVVQKLFALAFARRLLATSVDLVKGVSTQLNFVQKALVAIRAASLFLLTSRTGLVLVAISAVLLVIANRTGLLDKAFRALGFGAAEAESKLVPLSEFFANLAPQIAQGTAGLGEFQKRVEELEKELREAQARTQFEIATVGIEGAARSQREELFRAENALREEARGIDREIVQANQDLLGLTRQRERIARGIGTLSKAEQATIEDGLNLAKEAARLQSQQAQIDTDRARADLDAQRARAEGDDDALAAAQRRLSLIDDEAGLLDRLSIINRLNTNEIGREIEEAFGIEGAEEFRRVIEETVQIEGRQIALGEQLRATSARRLELENLFRDAALERVAAIAERETPALIAQTEELILQAKAAERINAARGGSLFSSGGQDLAVAEAENAVFAEQARGQAVLARLESDRAATLELLDQSRGTEHYISLLEQVEGQNSAIGAQQRLNNASLEAATRELEKQRAIASTPISAGVEAGVQEFADRALNAFEQVKSQIVSGLESLSENISGRITDALFNQDDAQSTKERFHSFFKDLARLAIDELVKIGVAKLALSFFNEGGLVEGGAGAFKGGPTNRLRGRARPSLAHYAPGVQGFSHGGRSRRRPRGVDRRDTIPAWLSPGEFVEPSETVRAYGADFFEALRRRTIDAPAARALMGSGGSGHAAHVSRGPGHISGGLLKLIPTLNTLSRLGVIGGDDDDDDKPKPRNQKASEGATILPATPTTARRINAGGRAAQYRFQAENRTSLRQTLRIRTMA